jgi:peptidoglycan hydrolase-like protein with peptidoglycan-binding domain
LPVVLVSPPPGRTISPRAPVTLTFSKPLKQVLASAQPRFSTRVSGAWHQTDGHTLVFTPSGLGWPLASSLRLGLPGELSVSSGAATAPARAIAWQVAGASFLRLQQLLAEAGYLPLDWQPAGTPVAREAAAEIDAAVSPPAGTFHWRYSNTPSELQRLWIEGQPNQIIRGAVMMFQHDHNLAVDSFAGAQVWHALLADAIAGTKRTDGYSYVFVHRNVPQLLTLWHNGQTVLTSPGNTGVPAAPTQLGTYPVFEHIPVGTMSGTNPDGSHYNDPGIRWISYVHQGEALHAFTRASFGTPQSLGCVELPLATAARVWPYTPIGTLVTIED